MNDSVLDALATEHASLRLDLRPNEGDPPTGAERHRAAERHCGRYRPQE